jgi:hypothetical protein
MMTTYNKNKNKKKKKKVVVETVARERESVQEKGCVNVTKTTRRRWPGTGTG